MLKIQLRIAILISFITFLHGGSDLKVKIKGILDSHLVQGEKWGLKYHFYRPGLVKYGPYQWLWDSAFHMISWSNIDVENSILDLRTMLQKQNRRNSKIPEMIFWGKESYKDQVLNRLFFTDPTVTDITQMPMLSFALKSIYQKIRKAERESQSQSSNRSIQVLEEFLPRLIEYHEWWAIHRQPDNDGKVIIIHPWESGLDASPMYDEALNVKNPQPTLTQLYPKFEQLQLSYRFLFNWNLHKILQAAKKSAQSKLGGFLKYFVMKEVGVNSVYTAGWKIYAELSRELNNNKMAEYCQKQYRHFLNGTLSMWDQDLKRFTSQYLDEGQYKRTRANTVQALFPILISDLPTNQKESIIRMLQDEKHYRSEYPIPSVSRSDPAYNPVFTIDLMWRGPSWAAPNYFILEGLKLHNSTELYKEIAGKWVKGVQKNGIWEMWNPQTGQGYGVENLGMSTSVVDVEDYLKTV